MADVVDARTRSRMMSGIRGKNTRPELLIRRALHRLGYRYRLHPAGLPGKPDMVFPVRRAVIFVHGCFWHCHHCHLFRWPSSRQEFWQEKITRNRAKDAESNVALQEAGWRVLTIWECALKGRTRLPFEQVIARSAAWLEDGKEDVEIEGDNTSVLPLPDGSR